MNTDRGITVLAYHDIDDSSTSVFSVSEEEFEKQMMVLKDMGYQSISPEDLFLWMEGEINLPERSILITFDDAGLSQYTKAFPIMKKYAFKGTLFLPGDFVEKQKGLSLAHVKEMIDYGFSVGAHSMTHISLLGLKGEGLKKEVQGAKLELEKMIVKGIDSFAYPFGFFDKVVEKKLQESKYLLAFTVIPGKNFKDTPRYELRRRLVLKYDTIPTFKKRIESDKAFMVDLYNNMIPRYIGKGVYRAAEIMLEELLKMDESDLKAKETLEKLRKVIDRE